MSDNSMNMIREAMRILREAGYDPRLVYRSKHRRVEWEDGRQYMTFSRGSAPMDVHTVRNIRSKLRRLIAKDMEDVR